MDRNEAATYLRTLAEKLARIRNYIIANADKQDGKLKPEFQHAVRITESGSRELNRCFQIDYGDNPMLREACLAEQSLKQRDRGDILHFQGRNHLVGCFTCQACDYDYVDSAEGGMPVRRPNSRLCSSCKAGVQHSAISIRPKTPLEASESDPGYPSAQTEPEIAPGANVSDLEVVLRVYLCDSCGAQAEEVLPTEG